MSARHVLGPAPHVFSLDVDEPVLAGSDDASRVEFNAAQARRRWAMGRAARFAERASAANARRLEVRRISAQLQQVYTERQARKAKGSEREPEALQSNIDQARRLDRAR